MTKWPGHHWTLRSARLPIARTLAGSICPPRPYIPQIDHQPQPDAHERHAACLDACSGERYLCSGCKASPVRRKSITVGAERRQRSSGCLLRWTSVKGAALVKGVKEHRHLGSPWCCLGGGQGASGLGGADFACSKCGRALRVEPSDPAVGTGCVMGALSGARAGPARWPAGWASAVRSA